MRNPPWSSPWLLGGGAQLSEETSSRNPKTMHATERTALPPRRDGRNRHCLAASMAAAFKSLDSAARITLLPVTVPSAATSTSTMTVWLMWK